MSQDSTRGDESGAEAEGLAVDLPFLHVGWVKPEMAGKDRIGGLKQVRRVELAVLEHRSVVVLAGDRFDVLPANGAHRAEMQE